MISLALVEQEGNYIQLTLLGRACGRSSLSFESTLRLVEFLRDIQPEYLTAKRLIIMTQALPESDNTYTPMMKRGNKESIRQREATDRYSLDNIRVLQRYSPGFLGYYARCKRAAILWDWINGFPIEMIEKQYSTTPFQGRIGYGDIRKFADLTRFHLRSVYQIVNVMFLGEGPNEESIEAILKQLEVGIPADALGLLAIEIPLERGEYLALYKEGINTPSEFWDLPEDTAKRILGPLKIKEFGKLKHRMTNH